MQITINPGSPFLQISFYAIAAAVLAAASWLVLRATRDDGEDGTLRSRFFIGATLWVVIVSVASYSGLLLPRGGRPVAFALVVVSVVALGLVMARSRVGERLAANTPLAALIAFQAFRLPLELAMHRAYTEGLMPVQMSYSGRNFDIVTGATAVIVALALRAGIVSRAVAYAWNVVGLVLLINVVTIAILSTPVFAYFGPDRLNVWVMWMPYTLLPAVMVLAAWAGHLVIFRALRRR